MSVGQWDSDYIGGGGGKVSETTNKERGARVFRLQRRVGRLKGLNQQRRGWGQGVRLQRRGVGQGYSDYRVVEGQGGSD